MINIDINNKSIEKEVNFKIRKEGNLYNAFVFDLKTSVWKPVLPANSLLSSVLGALESEMCHVVQRLA